MNYKSLYLLSLLFLLYQFSCSNDEGNFNSTFYSINQAEMTPYSFGEEVNEGDTVDNKDFYLGLNLEMEYMVALRESNGGGAIAFGEESPPAVLGTDGLKDTLVNITLTNAFSMGDSIPSGNDISSLFSFSLYDPDYGYLNPFHTLKESLNDSAPHLNSYNNHFFLIPGFVSDSLQEYQLTMTFTFASGKEVKAQSFGFFLN